MKFYYRLYVDGSAIGNRNVDADTPAGWAVVCIQTKIGDDSHSSGKLQTELSGRVITDEGTAQFIGAEVGSNNTGELSAIYHALKHIEFGDQFNPEGTNYVIYGDSLYAGKMAQGEWFAKENKALVKRVHNLWTRLKMAGINFSWSHVKAHSGHLWNERADHLALYEANRETPVPINEWLAKHK